MRAILQLTVLFCVLQMIFAIPIDNAISGTPDVQCNADSISIVFQTLNAFVGKVFVKGYIQDKDCVKIGDNGVNQHMTINFDRCGLRRSREIFITKVDRAYRLNCFYMEASKIVSQQMEISMMTTQELKKQTQMPTCRYDILSGGPKGKPVRYAKIGDSIYHKWTCLPEVENIYCMRVHTCTVYDGQGGEVVQVLDHQGCTIDKYVLLDLEYTSDLMAGQESHVFKFADRPALYFNCQLELTIKDPLDGCTQSRPVCKEQTKVMPSVPTYEQPTEDEGYATQASENSYIAATDSYESASNDDTSHGAAAPPGVNPSQSDLTPDNSYEEVTSPKYDNSDSQRTSSRSSTSYDESPYKRLLRRKRNSTVHKIYPFDTINALHVADVDLPEQTIMVFGIEDGPPPTASEIRDSNIRGIFERDEDLRPCITTGRLMVLLMFFTMALGILLIAIIFTIRRQRLSLNEITDKSNFCK